MSLNALPNELLYRILHYFNNRNKEDLVSLVSLARSSHRLYKLITPYVYENLQSYHLPHLLRSLLRNRALGEHTKRIKIHTIYQFHKHDMYVNSDQDVSALTAADWALLKDLIAELYSHDIWQVWPAEMLETHLNEFGAEIFAAVINAKVTTEEYCAHWYACAAAGRHDALSALVLALLPALSHLSVESFQQWCELEFSVFREDRDYVSRLMRGAANAQAKAIAMEAERMELDPNSDARLLADVLPRLRSVDFDYTDDESQGNQLGISHMLPFMRLPLMERFCGSSIITDHGWVHAPGLELRSLEISSSTLTTENLGELVRCCPRLEELVYEPYESYYGFPLDEEIEPPLLMPRLRSAMGTLTKLDLAADHHLSPRYVAIARLGSLRDFAKLKHLSLRVEFLIGYADSDGPVGPAGPARLWEKLPRSLQRLTVKGSDRWGLLDIIPDLQALLQRKDEAVPALQQIFLSDVSPETERNDERVRSLRNSCEAHGVHLFVQDLRYFF